MRVALFALFLLAAAGAAHAQGDKGAQVCPTNNLGGADELTCRCDVVEPLASVWGSGPYTSDSSICSAAVHAGLLETASRPDGPHYTGTVTLNRSAGCSTYAPSTANGVTTLSYGSWDSSFFFPDAGNGECAGSVAGYDACPASMAGQGDTLTCACSAEATAIGSIWGTGIYTDDSAICKAALHAGVIGAEGGLVTVARAPGEKAYTASVSNGVESLNYGNWQGSLVFSAATEAKGK
jgi:hypothetical protein